MKLEIIHKIKPLKLKIKLKQQIMSLQPLINKTIMSTNLQLKNNNLIKSRIQH